MLSAPVTASTAVVKSMDLLLMIFKRMPFLYLSMSYLLQCLELTLLGPVKALPYGINSYTGPCLVLPCGINSYTGPCLVLPCGINSYTGPCLVLPCGINSYTGPCLVLHCGMVLVHLGMALLTKSCQPGTMTRLARLLRHVGIVPEPAVYNAEHTLPYTVSVLSKFVIFTTQHLPKV